MFKHLTDFSYTRNDKEAIGFYLVYGFVIFIINYVLIAIFSLAHMDSKPFIGIINCISCIAVSFVIIQQKKLINVVYVYVILALLSGLIAFYGGSILGFIIPVILTILEKKQPSNPISINQYQVGPTTQLNAETITATTYNTDQSNKKKNSQYALSIFKLVGVAIILIFLLQAFTALLLFSPFFIVGFMTLIAPIAIIVLFLKYKIALAKNSTINAYRYPLPLEIISIGLGFYLGWNIAALWQAVLVSFGFIWHDPIAFSPYIIITFLFTYLTLKAAQFVYSFIDKRFRGDNFHRFFLVLLISSPILLYSAYALTDINRQSIHNEKIMSLITLSQFKEFPRSDGFMLAGNLSVPETNVYSITTLKGDERSYSPGELSIDGENYTDLPEKQYPLTKGLHKLQYMPQGTECAYSGNGTIFSATLPSQITFYISPVGRYGERASLPKTITYNVKEHSHQCPTTYTYPAHKGDSLIFTKPKGGEKLCIGQPYTIEWTADNSIQDITLHLNQSANDIGLSLMFDPDIIISPGKVGKNGNYQGSFQWQVGKVITDTPIPEDSGYNIGAEVRLKNGITPPIGQIIFASNNFTISSCGKSQHTTQPVVTPQHDSGAM